MEEVLHDEHCVEILSHTYSSFSLNVIMVAIVYLFVCVCVFISKDCLPVAHNDAIDFEWQSQALLMHHLSFDYIYI